MTIQLTKPPNSLQKLKQLVDHVLPADTPSDVMVDHQKADNPYKSWCGDANWEREIWKAGKLKSNICITELIEHVMKETKRNLREEVQR